MGTRETGDSTRSRPTWRLRIAVLLGTPVLLFLAFELGARLAFPPPQYFHSLPYDAEFGFRPPSRAHLINTDPEGQFPFRLNRLGFRGPSPGRASKEPGKRRLLFLGDSFLMGWQVREEDLLPFSTAQEMRRKGQATEAFSLACDGYGTIQQWLLLRKHGPQVQPDDVILCFFVGNDVSDNSIDLVGRTLVSAGGYLRPFLRPESAPSSSLATTDLLRLNPVRTAVRRYSRCFQLVEHRLLRMGWVDSLSLAPGVTLDSHARVAQGQLPFAYMDLFRPALGEHWRAALADTQRALAAVRDEAEQLGARFHVLIIPHKSQVQRDALGMEHDQSTVAAGQPGLDEQLDWEVAEQRIQEVCSSLGIPALSMLQRLRERTRAEGRSFYQHDGHWNGRGHRAASEALARSLLELPLDPQAESQPAESTPVDLPSLVLTKPEVDFEKELHSELVGGGFHAWRSDWWGETRGWMMGTSAQLLVPNRMGRLVLRGWLPATATVPLTVRVGAGTYRIDSTGPFELAHALQTEGRTGYRLIRLGTDHAFTFLQSKQAGLVLQGYRLEETED